MKKIVFILSFALVVLLLWIVLGPNYVFAATIQNNPTTQNDSNYQVIEMFKSLDNQLCVALENGATTGKNSIFPYLSLAHPYLWYIDNTNVNRMYIAFYNESTPILGGYTIDIYNNNNSQITCDGYKIETIAVFRIDYSNLSITLVDNSTQNHYIPSITYNYFGDSLLQTMRNLGWIGDSATISDLRSGLATINSSVVSEGDQTQQAINSTAQATQNTINSTAQATQNTINSTSQQTQNIINQQTQQQQQNYDEFSNSNSNSINTTGLDIDTSFIPTNDDLNLGNFLQGFFSTIQNLTSFEDRDYIITIPIRDELSFTLSTAPITQFYRDNQVLSSLISLFWTFIFGRYFLAFGMRILHWLQGGDGGYSAQGLSNVMTEYNVIMKDILFM